VDAWRRLVKLGGAPGKAASALVKLHVARKELDEAYTAAQVVVHLGGGATPDEKGVVERLRRLARETASQPLDDKSWALVFQERIRGPAAEILALLAREAAGLFAQAPKSLGLDPRKGEVDVSSQLLFANSYRYVARTLGFLQPPRLYRVEAPAGRVALVPTQPLALAASEDLFGEKARKKDLWFAIGKAMAFARPELTLAKLMPHDQLEVVFQAACSLGTSRFMVTARNREVESVRQQLAKLLPPDTQARRLKLLARAYTEVRQTGDVRSYMDGAEMAGNRVGALLAGDLEVARRMILQEKAQVSKLRDEAKLGDLVQFCLSGAWSALRARLGIAVAASGNP
jgi:hypothetical protein